MEKTKPVSVDASKIIQEEISKFLAENREKILEKILKRVAQETKREAPANK